MNRAERRRQAKELSKSKMPLPLNVALPVEGAADINGQEAVVLKTYLELKEKEIRENVTTALMKEAQEKLTRAEDYIAIINILIILYASKMAWGYTEENKKLMENYKAARVYVDRVGAAAAYAQIKKEMDIEIEFEDLDNYNIYKEKRIFAKWKGTEHWSNAMFEKRSDEVLVTVEYPDGTRVTEATYTIDGKWKMIAKVLGGTVIAWKPFPEPYKEN